MSEEDIRIVRNYEITPEVYEWLKEKAKDERRSVKHQVGIFLEGLMLIDLKKSNRVLV